ncbi:MAG TPA: glycosyltransferase [Nitrospirae bacterium]|nr:glycosyltransferase [Nitrospirota bacterium]
MSRIYKADLHVHSKHSNKPTIWALRKVNCPESFTSPDHIYKTAIKRGMDYVTITDHNTINGALEIAHHANTFISSEITVSFPEDSCKVHVVVLGIQEDNFKELLRRRKDIYEFTKYLRRNNIAHFLAHPLYDLNGKLKLETIEKLFVLFNVFEVINGSRASRYNSLLEKLLLTFDREIIERIACAHDIEPFGERPWIKGMVGGSDDHSGIFIARAYTVSRLGGSVNDFISSTQNAESWAAGEHGDPLTLAHAIYGIGYNFFSGRFEGKNQNSRKPSYPFIKTLLSEVFDAPAAKLSVSEKIKLFFGNAFRKSNDNFDDSSIEEVLDSEARNILNDRHFLKSLASGNVNRKIFSVTSYLANRILYAYIQRLTKTYSSLGLFDLVHSFSAIGVSHLLVSPYYIAHHIQQRSKKLLAELEVKYFGNNTGATEKVALFTDTLNEINGVAITIKRILETSKQKGVNLTVITSDGGKDGFNNGVMNFKSVGAFSLPEYPELKMSFPPILNMIDYFEREGFTRIHISTPGSLGLIGLFLAKLFDVPVSGTYHTDIPQYVKKLTDDDFMEGAAWSFMIWFYNMLDEVTAPSVSTRTQLVEKGLSEAKIKLLPRWVDTGVFSPDKKNPRIWEAYGLGSNSKIIYVGRVSKEKNLPLLVTTFRKLIDEGSKADLIIVGDGPYKKEMEDELQGYPALFTGFMAGEELSALYASASIFVFPSATDTFGNVVLEAQASGLPVIVTNEGGPKELIVDKITGFVVKANSADDLFAAVKILLDDKAQVTTMGSAARRFALANAPISDHAYSTIFNFGENASQDTVIKTRLVGA